MFGVYYFGQPYFAQGPGETPPPPAVVASDNAPMILGDLQEAHTCAPGVLGLGDGGMG
jgi:hypothetical protein